MGPSKWLARPMPCRHCSEMIPSGTPLSTLDWDRGERAWSHRRPPCEEASATVPKVARVPPTSNGPARLTESSTDSGPLPEAGPPLSDYSQPGAWSVTVEIHEAEDPAQSKRVLRIARLHLGTYADARVVAEQLRRVL
jgi:hypothetical protein